MVIDNSKLMRSAGCSEEERGLIWQTAAGNWAYSGIRLTENSILMTSRQPDMTGQEAWEICLNQSDALDLGSDISSAVFP